MAETRIELNTGFTSGPDGLHRNAKMVTQFKTPSAMPSEGEEGAIKRKVLQPDEFPRVDLSVVCPHDPEDADVDQSNVNKSGSQPSRQGKVRGSKTNDGKSLTA